MSKRSVARGFLDLLLSGIGIALILAAVLIMLIRAYPLQIAALGAVGFGSTLFLRRRSAELRQSQWRGAEDCTKQEIERHKTALISYFRQSIRTDLFGNEDASIWNQRNQTFLDTQVVPKLTTVGITVNAALARHLTVYVDDIVRSESAASSISGEQSPVDPTTLSPIEYEHHCAVALSRCGWRVRPTPVTGDHGADVVAEKNGRVLVVQCKLYSRPVGNKAVQEVNAARSLYNASDACVVAPAGFTAQAQREAHALCVHLLHHAGIETLAQELFEQSGAVSKTSVIGSRVG